MKLQAPHNKTTLQVLIDAFTAINYHNEEVKPHLSKVSRGERKEYEEVQATNIKQHRNATQHINAHQWVFGEILHQYDMSVLQFISKFTI